MEAPTSIGRPWLPPLAGVVLLLGTVSDAPAQTRSLTWTETVRVEVPGALGALLRATGATAPSTSRNAVHLQGTALIQESDNSSTVMDLANARWTMADHQARIRTTLTFDEMAQMTEEALRDGHAAAAGAAPGADAAAAREEFERAMEEARANVEFRVSSQATGQRRQIGARDAAQHFILTEFLATAVPEGVDEPEGGSIVFLAELWQAGDVPDGSELYAEWARQLAADATFRDRLDAMAESGEEASEAIARGLTAWNPQIGAGIMRMAEAIGELEGTTVRSTVTVALVPLGVALDREALLAWEPATAGEQLRAGAADVARDAAADAVRGAVGALGGRIGLGRGRAEPTPDPAPVANAEPQVRPLLRITTTREDMEYRQSSDDVVGALEARIADYETRSIDAR